MQTGNKPNTKTINNKTLPFFPTTKPSNRAKPNWKKKLKSKKKETILISNSKMKQTKMTQQQPTEFHKTPKPCKRYIHNINIIFSSHSQTQQPSKTKLENKLLNQRKVVKSQPCTTKKLENKAPPKNDE